MKYNQIENQVSIALNMLPCSCTKLVNSPVRRGSKQDQTPKARHQLTSALKRRGQIFPRGPIAMVTSSNMKAESPTARQVRISESHSIRLSQNR